MRGPLLFLGLTALLVVLFNIGMHPGVFNLATSLLVIGVIGATIAAAWLLSRIRSKPQ